MRKPRDSSTYEVGYGKPPKHTRFMPGQSGNLKGRPRGALDLATTLQDALNEQMSITENGRTRKVRKFDLMIKTALHRAIKGDARALNAITALMQRCGVGVGETEDAEVFTAEDAEALERYINDRLPELPSHDA